MCRSDGAAGASKAVAHADALDRDLGDPSHDIRLLDLEAVQDGRHDVDGVVVLLANLAAGLDSGRPGDDAGVGGAALEGRVALPHLERGVEGHGPAGRVVVVGLQPTELVERLDVVVHGVRNAVHEKHLVDRTVWAALAAGAVVGHHDDDRVVQLPDLLQMVDQPADLVITVGQEPGVDLGHPGRERLLAVGHVGPTSGLVQCRERLAVRTGPGGRRAEWVDVRQFGVQRDDALFLLLGQHRLSGLLVAVVELALVLLDPLLGHVVRRMRAARCVVQEHRLIRSDRLDVVDVGDGPVGHVHGQVVAVLRRIGLLDRVVVVDQVRVPLVGLGAEEAVEPFESAAQRPVRLGRGHVHLVVGGEVPFADSRGPSSPFPPTPRPASRTQAECGHCRWGSPPRPR